MRVVIIPCQVTEIMMSYIKRNPAQSSNFSCDENVIRKTAASVIMIVVQDEAIHWNILSETNCMKLESFDPEKESK